MSKHHPQSKAEQIDNKAHGAAPIHHEKTLKYSSIQPRASQEKGGSDLDHWLEAEQFLRKDNQAVSRLINEGDPIPQK